MLSITSKTIFNFNGNSYCFVNFNIFNMFCLLSQNSKIAEKENGSKRNSITQCPILIKVGTNVKNNIVYNVMKRFFEKKFIFELRCQCPNWLRPDYHDHQFKNSGFVILFSCIYPLNMVSIAFCLCLFACLFVCLIVCLFVCLLVCLGYICFRVKPIRELAWLPWQREQNN